MMKKHIYIRILLLLVVWVGLYLPTSVGATPSEELLITIEFGPDFANPLSGSWSVQFQGWEDSGEAFQYWSHSGNLLHYVNNHTENILVSDEGTLTIRSNAKLITTFLEDGFTQTGSGSFRIISGSGDYSNLHGEGEVDVDVHYYNDGESEVLRVVMAFHGNGHIDPNP